MIPATYSLSFHLPRDIHIHCLSKYLQRSYSPDVFSMVLSRLTANNIVPINEIELLKNLADMTQRIWKQKAQNEEDFGDDVPDDFRGNFFLANYL